MEILEGNIEEVESKYPWYDHDIKNKEVNEEQIEEEEEKDIEVLIAEEKRNWALSFAVFGLIFVMVGGILLFISDSDFRQRKRTIDYDILLFGSSLQFLREPEIDIKKLINTGVKSLIFEQTPFVLSGYRQLTVQQINEPIYDSSYPAWHFDENEFMTWIGNRYQLRYQSHNPHVTNHCNNFSSTLRDFVFTEIS